MSDEMARLREALDTVAVVGERLTQLEQQNESMAKTISDLSRRVEALERKAS